MIINVLLRVREVAELDVAQGDDEVDLLYFMCICTILNMYLYRID